jgi:hypothetical protein
VIEPVAAKDFVQLNADWMRRAGTPAAGDVDPEVLVTAGSYVQREFGLTGYRVCVIAGLAEGALFGVHANDGSGLRVWVDRFGNVERVPA